MTRRAWPRRRAAALLLLPLLGHAQPLPGRWEGQAQVSGQAVAVLLDLTEGAPRPTGYLTLPGRSVQRLRLRFELRDGLWRGTASALPGSADGDGPAIELQTADSAQRWRGQLRQGGHAAPLLLNRSGEAPPAEGVPSSALSAAALGVWHGRYDIGFGPRDATLRVMPSGVTMTVVGRRTSEIVFDEAVQRGQLLMLRASAASLAIDAPAAGLAQGVLAASIRFGPFDAPLELRREQGPR
ncbi:MAG: hypothetical protein JNJ71_21050 [Rubrivivax sp.]|nr:hypothetical protein [Rubrivivax sp.]